MDFSNFKPPPTIQCKRTFLPFAKSSTELTTTIRALDPYYNGSNLKQFSTKKLFLVSLHPVSTNLKSMQNNVQVPRKPTVFVMKYIDNGQRTVMLENGNKKFKRKCNRVSKIKALNAS